MPPDEGLSRRHMLAVLGTGAVFPTAGCAGDSDDGGDDDQDDTSPPDEDDADDTSQNGDDSPTPENEPPEILDYDVEPTDFGTRLLVTLEGEDNQEIERAAISYGDLRIEETPESPSVSVEGALTDIHEADLEETPGTVIFALEDVEGEVTEKTTRPHTGSPSVSIESAATTNPDELALAIEATDEIGLYRIQVDVNGNSVEQIDVTGSAETEQELRIDADGVSDGKMNEITSRVRNTFGTTQDTTRDQYVREFEPLEDQDTEIGAVYLPFFENKGRWADCAVGESEAGRYTMDDHHALNRHGDLMNGFGISRVKIDYSVPNDPLTDSFFSTRDETLLSEIPLEVLYAISNSMKFRGENSVVDQIERSLEYARDTIFEQPNLGTREGKPVFDIWNLRTVTWGGDAFSLEVKESVLDEWGDFESFGGYMRETLTKDGTEPYMIADTSDLGRLYLQDSSGISEILELVQTFDAVTNWTGKNVPGETTPRDEALSFQEENFQGYNQLANDLNIDYIPRVYPSFDDRENDCWGDDRYTPRSTEFFREMLNLADQYRTVDQIDVATWNDWGEGHQIEPGEHGGEAFGTEYLEVVKEFSPGDA